MTSSGRGGKRIGAGRKLGDNVTVRVTLPRVVWTAVEAQAALEDATPGELLAAAYRAATANPVLLRAPAEPQSLEGVTAFRVLSASIDQRTRNRFRWPAANYPRMEALLAQGEMIQLIHEDGKDKWRTAQDDVIRRDTLVKLTEAGNLEPLI
jgi:hypothetical protein